MDLEWHPPPERSAKDLSRNSRPNSTDLPAPRTAQLPQTAHPRWACRQRDRPGRPSRRVQSPEGLQSSVVRPGAAAPAAWGLSAREPARGERASEEALYKRAHFIGSHTHVRGTLLELPSVQHGRQQHCAACIGRKLPDCLHVDHAGDRGAILTGDSGLRAAIG